MPIANKIFETTRNESAGIPISDIVSEFGTPAYVYDMSIIEERVRDLSAFDVVRYAQKACSNIGILNRLKGLGVVVDAVSVGEVKRALAAGFDPHGIVFTADVFDREALALVKELGLHVNCGSQI